MNRLGKKLFVRYKNGNHRQKKDKKQRFTYINTDQNIQTTKSHVKRKSKLPDFQAYRKNMYKMYQKVN